MNTAMHSPKALSGYFSGKEILPLALQSRVKVLTGLVLNLPIQSTRSAHKPQITDVDGLNWLSISQFFEM